MEVLEQLHVLFRLEFKCFSYFGELEQLPEDSWALVLLKVIDYSSFVLTLGSVIVIVVKDLCPVDFDL